LIVPADNQPTFDAPNRFRKVAESIVQANRLAVENAKPDSARHPARGRRTELQPWQAGSFDTATWLYNLVFAAGIDQDKLSKNPRILQRQPSVSDYVSDAEDDNTGSTYEVPHSSSNTAMITWNEQTRPSSVVDRLLNTWTTLSTEQIRSSATPDGADEGSEDLMATINVDNEQDSDEKVHGLDPGWSDEVSSDAEASSMESVTLPSLPGGYPGPRRNDDPERDNSTMTDGRESFSRKHVHFGIPERTKRTRQNLRDDNPTNSFSSRVNSKTTNGTRRNAYAVPNTNIHDPTPIFKDAPPMFRDDSPIRVPHRPTPNSARGMSPPTSLPSNGRRDPYVEAWDHTDWENDWGEGRKSQDRKMRQNALAEQRKLEEERIYRVERKKLEHEYKKRVEKWEQSLAAFEQDRISIAQKDSTNSVPKRVSRIQGDAHRIEVAEYTEMLEPLPSVIDGLLRPTNGERTHDKKIEPVTPSPKTSSSSRAQDSFHAAFSKPLVQPILLFSPHLDRSSIKTCELQLSLSQHGLPAEFENIDNAESKDGFVRCTISWEHPMFIQGSELLRTLRGYGWKPFYFRGSGK
jgi:hypothetical protein